ncbi:MAG: ISAs1 family transposase [Candidatus Hinthialibacter sp.]
MTSLEPLRNVVQGWNNLNLIGMVKSERHVGRSVSIELKFYISSFNCKAERFAQFVRNHWGIENSVYWILDMAFREDESRIRIRNAAENLSILRHLALNLIQQEKSTPSGTQVKRMKAAWDDNYMLKLLTQKREDLILCDRPARRAYFAFGNTLP